MQILHLIDNTTWRWADSSDATDECAEVSFYTGGTCVFIYECGGREEIHESALGKYICDGTSVTLLFGDESLKSSIAEGTMTLSFEDGEPVGGVFVKQ